MIQGGAGGALRGIRAWHNLHQPIRVIFAAVVLFSYKEWAGGNLSRGGSERTFSVIVAAQRGTPLRPLHSLVGPCRSVKTSGLCIYVTISTLIGKLESEWAVQCRTRKKLEKTDHALSKDIPLGLKLTKDQKKITF